MKKPWTLDLCTLPNKDLFPEMSELNEHVPEFLGEMGALIRETITFGTRVFDWTREQSREITDQEGGTARVVVMSQFRFALDLLASLEAQVRAGCGDMAKITLRALFEVRLSLEYMLKENTVDRAYSFLVCEQHKSLRFLEMQDEEHPRGREHQRLLEEENLSLEEQKPLQQLRAEIDSLREILASPPTPAAKRAADEYVRVKSARRSPPSWYSLFCGPGNLRDLAIRLNNGGAYDIFYRMWSATVHSTDLLTRLRSVSDRGVGFRHLRCPDDAQHVTGHALREAVHLMRQVVERLVPKRAPDLGAWYLRVRDAFLFVQTGHQVLRPENAPATEVDWRVS